MSQFLIGELKTPCSQMYVTHTKYKEALKSAPENFLILNLSDSPNFPRIFLG